MRDIARHGKTPHLLRGGLKVDDLVSPVFRKLACFKEAPSEGIGVEITSLVIVDHQRVRFAKRNAFSRVIGVNVKIDGLIQGIRSYLDQYQRQKC